MTNPEGRVADTEASSKEQLETLEAFSRDDVVEFYATFIEDLLPGERYMFERAIPRGARLLDLGVGAGRTSTFLSERASRYVGLDFSGAMIEACRLRFPDLEFVQADASDLSMFSDGSFDVVVFSFNGIDCLHPDEVRLRCIGEIRRVLASGGTAVISEHNPRALLAATKPLRGVPAKVAAVRLARAAQETATRTWRLVRTDMFRSGEGYYFDREHGGNWWHAATPARVVAEWQQMGFERVGEIVAFDHPAPAGALHTGWYYYAFQKPS